MALRLAKTCSVCSATVAPVSALSPGRSAIWPETKTRLSTRTAWEYGAPCSGAGAFSVRIANFFAMMVSLTTRGWRAWAAPRSRMRAMARAEGCYQALGVREDAIESRAQLEGGQRRRHRPLSGLLERKT